MSKRKKKMIEEIKEYKKEEIIPKVELISFDAWWMGFTRKVKIRPSYKEIIIADFKARGLSMNATQAEYDSAIEMFGIKLPT